MSSLLSAIRRWKKILNQHEIPSFLFDDIEVIIVFYKPFSRHPRQTFYPPVQAPLPQRITSSCLLRHAQLHWLFRSDVELSLRKDRCQCLESCIHPTPSMSVPIHSGELPRLKHLKKKKTFDCGRFIDRRSREQLPVEVEKWWWWWCFSSLVSCNSQPIEFGVHLPLFWW